MIDLLAPLGAHVAAAEVTSTFTELAAGGGQGTGTVSDADGTLYSFRYTAAAPAQLDTAARLWYLTEGGLAYWQFTFAMTAQRLGPLESCEVREDSVAATLVGGACEPGEGLVDVAPDATYEGEIRWMPGVFPA